MSRVRLLLACAALLLSTNILPAAGPPLPPLHLQVARWMQDLGDDRFAVREEAMRRLRAAGEAAEVPLIKALDSPDAEVRKRAKTLMAEFKWGIYPDTPDAVVQLINAYRAAARPEKGGVITKLLAAGVPGCRAVMKIARAEEDVNIRQGVFAELSAHLSRAVPLLLDGDKRAELEGLLELNLAGDPQKGVLNYAAYHLAAGQLPQRIADWERKAKAAVVPKAESEVLAYLYRANRDGDKARAAAVVAERNDLLEALLYEQANWPELAQRAKFPEGDDKVTYLAYRAAYARLGGNTKAYDEAVAALRKEGAASPARRAGGLAVAKALFMNGQPAAAVEVLTKDEREHDLLFEVLVAQLRIKDALALVEEARTNASPRLPNLEILEARVLYPLGGKERERALATLKRYTDDIKAGVSPTWYRELFETEASLGRVTEACAVVGKILEATNDLVWMHRLFDKLYEKQAEDATVLWSIFRRLERKEPYTKTFERVRHFVESKATAKDVGDLMAKLRDAKVIEGADGWRMLGDVCARTNAEAAIECYRRADTPRSLAAIGDLLARKKDWAAAAKEYEAAYQLIRKQASVVSDRGESLPCLALWLWGNALVQAGKPEGKEYTERAHLLPLGDAEMRYEFLLALRRRGHAEPVRREQELLRLVGEPLLTQANSYYTGEGLRAAAIDAANRKQFLQAADGYEQTFLRVLRGGMNFARGQAYVTVPAHIHLLRARGLLAKDRFDEADREIERARASTPGSVDLAMTLVPELEAKGRKKEAEALFKAVLGVYQEALKEYPKAAWLNNQAAWLTATCRRDLPAGLEYARAAVGLVPDSASYLDTLAEVLFQMGKKDEAVAAIKKAIALSPAREYFRKQLKRMEAGDPKAARPEEEE